MVYGRSRGRGAPPIYSSIITTPSIQKHEERHAPTEAESLAPAPPSRGREYDDDAAKHRVNDDGGGAGAQ